jgi:hypothetical protein
VGSVFVGFMKRFVSAGVAVVEFNAGVLADPYGARSVRETLSSNKTLDAEDTGKLFWVDTDAFTICWLTLLICGREYGRGRTDGRWWLVRGSRHGQGRWGRRLRG